MAFDSTPDNLTPVAPRQAKSPRVSTLNFIRQFSRAYVTVSGTALNQLICN